MVQVWCYNVGDLVLRLVLPGAHKTSDGTFGPNWEGPYTIKKSFNNGAYHLAGMDGIALLRAWNAEHLKPYF